MDLVTAAIIESAEATLNLLLQTRPMLRERLTQLSGKTLRITLTPQNWSLIVRFNPQVVELAQDAELAADVSITGSATALIKLVTEPRSVLFGQGVEVEGDAALLQRIQKAMREPGLDWELWLSDLLGDLPTSALMQSIAPVAKTLKQGQSSIAHNLKSYLQEEIAALPSRVEYELWADAISQTELQTEQLTRRISRLNR